jgi:3-hydroxyisobutyrate dehydrogenase-like beta-hydroxyacid dehydrogenase
MSESHKTTVGFVGLGIMGGPMASHLQEAGYQLVVHDTRAEAAAAHITAGAIWADTPRSLAEQCDVVFTCLPNLAAIEQVALGPEGLVAGIRHGAAYFEMSTNSIDLVKRLHAAFAERGAYMLDAPISGGGPGARRARLGVFVGGDKAIYERWEPLLLAMADRPIHIGAVGAGLITKLINNCTNQCVQAAIAEVFAMGVKAGAEPLSLWAAMRQGAAGLSVIAAWSCYSRRKGFGFRLLLTRVPFRIFFAETQPLQPTLVTAREIRWHQWSFAKSITSFGQMSVTASNKPPPFASVAIPFGTLINGVNWMLWSLRQRSG